MVPWDAIGYVLTQGYTVLNSENSEIKKRNGIKILNFIYFSVAKDFHRHSKINI